MRRVTNYVIITIILVVCMPGFSQDADNGLTAYLELAARNNPELKAAYNQYLAALEKIPQVSSLPDPETSFGFFIKPMELLGGKQAANIQLMQMFPWFGTLKAARNEVSMMANARYESFNAVKAELYFQVKSSWYQLMKYDREIALVQDHIELLRSLEKQALIKFQSSDAGGSREPMSDAGPMDNSGLVSMSNNGSGMAGMNNAQNTINTMTTGSSQNAMPSDMNGSQSGLQDVLRVRMEILDQENKLALLTDQRQTEESRFNAMLNRELDTRVVTADSLVAQDLPFEKQAIPDSILSNNPMLSMLENETNAYAFMEQKAKRMGLPMLGIGLNYMVVQQKEGNTSMMNGKDMIMPMFSISLPIYRKKYRAMHNEAILLQEAGKAQTLNTRNNLFVQYRQLIQNLDDAERRISLYNELEDLARRTASLLLTGFMTNGSNYEEVLRMQMKVLDYGFRRVEAIVDYNTGVAMVVKITNTDNY